MEEKIKPIIKWTGGKYSEFALFKSEIPTFKRYIEPFFGGGGVLFALQPQCPIIINDKSKDLINFYRSINQPEFHVYLISYAQLWEELGVLSRQLWTNCKKDFIELVNGNGLFKTFADCLTLTFFKNVERIDLCNNENFILDVALFKQMVLASVLDKAKRIKGIGARENKKFIDADLINHFETGIRSGAYLFFRHILNQHWKGMLELDQSRAAANWYFVREFCYGSMFRFNRKGEFNIPYGGITYNRKKFRQKIEKISAPKVRSLFHQTSISNLDFEIFLGNLDLNEDDFIFLDPPYDSEFSNYDQNTFNKSDQERLSTLLLSLKAKWMVIIKDTAFIRKIYTHPAVNIKTFYKNYAYNMRGRNNRDVQHLIITNF